MFILRNENQEIGYFGENEKVQRIEVGDQVCLSLEENEEIDVVAEIISIADQSYTIKIIEFESDDQDITKISLKLNQVLDVDQNLIQYCYKKEDQK